jgi:hypothetical protein
MKNFLDIDKRGKGKYNQIGPSGACLENYKDLAYKGLSVLSKTRVFILCKPNPCSSSTKIPEKLYF